MKHHIIVFILAFSASLFSYSISGQINYSDNPIDGAVVELYAQQPHMNNSLLDTTISDSSGNYQFELSNPGMYYVAAFIDQPIYQTLFFEQVANPNLATPIHVNNMNPNIINIDFSFEDTLPFGDNMLIGLISDVNGNPVESAKITLLPQQYSNPWQSSFFAFSDQNGNYLLSNIPDGNYLLSVRHQSFFPYYFNNATGWMNADIITLQNGAVIEINVMLNSNEQYLISGFVTDAQSFLPIQDASVYAIPYSGQHSSCGGCATGNLPFVQTDENGFYQLLLAADLYLLMAIDPITDDVVFYDNAASPLSANWISLNDDLENIDFVMNENLGGNLSLEGTISFSAGNPNNAVPILAVAVSSEEDWEETVVVDNFSGGYIIPDLPTGSFYVYGFSPLAIPTYFEDAIMFENADLIEVTSNLSNIDIVLQEGQENGYLLCTGIVIDQNGMPVENATVAFLDALGNIHDYALTDQSGMYEVPFLSSMNYLVIATKLFFDSEIVTLPVYGNQNWNFVLTSPNTSVGNTQLKPLNQIDIRVFPNPAFASAAGRSLSTMISFSSEPNEFYELSIYNIKGQKVKSISPAQSQDSTIFLAWDGTDDHNTIVSAGIYLFRIKSEQHFGTAKLLLLK